jgi:hypothetical protein
MRLGARHSTSQTAFLLRLCQETTDHHLIDVDWLKRRRRGEIDDQTWMRTEAQIITAAREGRISGGMDIDGK